MHGGLVYFLVLLFVQTQYPQISAYIGHPYIKVTRQVDTQMVELKMGVACVMCVVLETSLKKILLY